MKVYNPNLPKNIVDELYYLNDRYFAFDEPVPLKKGLLIYPVSIKYHDDFIMASDCLTIDKTESIEGIQSTNLSYLLLKMNDKNNEMEAAKFSQHFIRICELCFQMKYGICCKKCGKIYDYWEFLSMMSNKDKPFSCECGNNLDDNSEGFDANIKYKLNEDTKQREVLIYKDFKNPIVMTSEDFDRFRQIVMYQNLPDYKDDSWVDPDMREDQREKQRLLAKKNNGATASLERKIVCVAAKSNYTIKEIYELTMRKFIMLLSVIDDAMNYECTRIGLMTGMVSTKEPIEHWVYKKESDDLYGDGITVDSMQAKISSAST